jgi:hypothetical protein
MNAMRRWAAVGVVAVLAAGGCRPAGQTPGTLDVNLNDVEGRISGPYGHKNLTFFLIDAVDKDDRDFLTLDEGLTSGQVRVSEQEKETVGELRIDNQSDRPLYLQEGERLQGGKQDRTIIASMVVPPKSGWTAVRANCVEQSRWTEGARGGNFAFSANAALAPKGVRGAAKVDGSQLGVWKCVTAQKATAGVFFESMNTNSSLNETLDSPEVQKISDEFAAALTEALDKRPDSVGVAVAINGQLEEADIYPNHAVLKKLGPRLIQSYALQAEMLKDPAQAGASVSAADVAGMLQDGVEKSKRPKDVDAHNTLLVRELEGNRFQCTTEYEGKQVHLQMLKKNGTGDVKLGDGTTRAARLGGDW